MSETKPKITIIVTVLNGKSTLERCLNSVASQTYTHKELIVIDGGSSDGTVDLLKNYAKTIDYWESQKDRGIYHAFNKGVKRSTGDWIMFLGSDDYLWDEQVLEKVAERLVNLSKIGYVAYGQVTRVSENNTILETVNQSWSKSKNSFRYYFGNMDHQGVFHHKNIFEEYGFFDESFKICADYELLLRYLANHDPDFLENLTIVGRQVGGVSHQIKNSLKMYQENEKARQNKKLNPLKFLLFTPYRVYFYLKAIVHLFMIRFFGERFTFIITDIYRQISFRSRVWTKL